eukprot:TRINITY_DN30592_c0_g2_i1.p1 TRINITY_DN30592_c0_g2~~TRINITY_DN30592_c0_g2_i1.p1  ORF type:complete len:175 (-),score=40.28 TRINITY_DN30592_c0_g2_i1:207-731(-)
MAGGAGRRSTRGDHRRSGDRSRSRMRRERGQSPETPMREPKESGDLLSERVESVFRDFAKNAAVLLASDVAALDAGPKATAETWDDMRKKALDVLDTEEHRGKKLKELGWRLDDLRKRLTAQYCGGSIPLSSASLTFPTSRQMLPPVAAISNGVERPAPWAGAPRRTARPRLLD